ncbi:MAG: ice-binding family protein, partial [Bacteroidia bacterium]
IFWKVEGLVSMASGTTMRGTVIANNAAINIGSGDTLEGRALTTAGAVTVNGVLAYTPIGCGSPVLNGPVAPDLGGAGCYAIFSSVGAVSNSGITHITGDVGSNSGSATGYNPAFVIGTIHTIPDGSTAACASDLLSAYTYVNGLPYDIQLLYPAQFGNNLVLTPHTYLLNAATVFTDTLYLNAEGNANAVFVIQINGALSTSTYSKVKLINGAQAKNVYWKIEGAVSINNYSVFCGTIICNNGALGAINTGVVLNGRALTTNGALSTTATTAVASSIPTDCATLGIQSLTATDETVKIYPNPVNSSTTIFIEDTSQLKNVELIIFNSLGEIVVNTTITKQETVIDTNGLLSGIYFYKIIGNDKVVQSGKLISQQ